jgi:hypothetical protein
VRATCPIELGQVHLESPNLASHLLQLALALGSRFSNDQRRLTVGRFTDLVAELLGAHQGVVQRLVALAKCAKLLVEALCLRVQVHRLTRQALELLRHLLAESLHARRVVAAHRATEVVAPHIQRREMKGLVH